ncbi:MAG TPA: hypothetical protein VN673_00555, partial [Clostridia bacterium]|nr:hypothetical protein [Clostridia bacterium]
EKLIVPPGRQAANFSQVTHRFCYRAVFSFACLVAGSLKLSNHFPKFLWDGSESRSENEDDEICARTHLFDFRCCPLPVGFVFLEGVGSPRHIP